MALPNAACPGLPQKPLDSAIKQLLAPYCPSGYQGNSKQNDLEKWTNFAGHFMAAAVRGYDTTCIAQWGSSRALLETTGRHHWASIAANICNWSHICHFFVFFIVNL
jgi:hypothetical protein